jgi:hypothetical protein
MTASGSSFLGRPSWLAVTSAVLISESSVASGGPGQATGARRLGGISERAS